MLVISCCFEDRLGQWKEHNNNAKLAWRCQENPNEQNKFVCSAIVKIDFQFSRASLGIVELSQQWQFSTKLSPR
jgi:hypothetical protein